MTALLALIPLAALALLARTARNRVEDAGDDDGEWLGVGGESFIHAAEQ